MLRPPFLISIIFACLVLFNGSLSAQEPQKPSLKDILSKEQQAEEISNEATIIDKSVPVDDYNRGQPRASIQGFLNAARSQDFERAAEYLDYRNISDRTLSIGKDELARRLSVVLDRALWVDLESMSEHHLGDLTEPVASYRELLGKVNTKTGSIAILMQRVPRESDRVKIWKISNATVEKIPQLHQEYSYTPLGEWLSKNSPSVSFLGVMLWQWVYFLGLIFVCFLIAKVFSWLMSKILKRFYPALLVETQKFIENPLALLLTIIISRIFVAEENATLAVKAIAEGATLLTIAWIWVLFKFVDLMKVKLSKRFIAQDKPLAIYLLRPAGTVIKSFILLFAVLIWFENLGFSATTLLAGLGIGGLAVALAAQKTVENIIGAITLYTSSPVKIGNFCRFGKQVGVVEEIGLRATRIRTLERTVVYVANAQFIDMQLENYSERECIVYRSKININPNAKGGNVEDLIEGMRDLLIAHPKTAESPLRVHAKKFTSYGIQLELFCYIETTDFDEYLEVINELNLAILALVKTHQCELSILAGIQSNVADVQG